MIDRDLILVKSEVLPDWYIVEWAEHDGREWLEPIGEMGLALRRSARVGDADVEGYAHEMRAIAQAIEDGTGVEFRRCAAHTRPDGSVELCSPRNSMEPAVVTRRAALTLVAAIRAMLETP